MSVSKAFDAGHGSFVFRLDGSNASVVNNAGGDITLRPMGAPGITLQATTGYVGIGNSSPRAALDVSGDVRFTGNLYQNANLFVGGGGGGGGQWATSNGYLSYARNVGIGTSLPAFALDVAGTLRSTAATFGGSATAYAFTSNAVTASSEAGPALAAPAALAPLASNVAWTSSNAYFPATGAYIGACQTVDAYGTAYSGEWLQIQFPSAVPLTAVTVATTNATTVSVLGSADGATWVPLAPPSLSPLAVTLTSAPTFAASFARLVFQSASVASSNVSVSKLQLAGTLRPPSVTISAPRIPTYGFAPMLAQPRGPVVGLQAHYPFGASLFDGGGSNLTLTAAGGVSVPQYVPGQTGTACLYLANEGYITNGPGKAGTYLNNAFLPVAINNATVVCWVFFTKMPFLSSYTSAVWSAGTTATEGIQLLATQTIGKISLYANTPAVGVSTPVVAVDLCTWVHVAVTFNVVAKTLSLYLNGVLASYAFNASLTAWGAFTVGDSVVPGTVRPFAGFIDDMRVFARILGNAEIMACSTLPLLPLTSNAIAPTQLGGPWVLGGGGSLGNDVSGTTAYFSFEAFTVADAYGRFTSNVGLSNAVFAVPGAIAGANVCLDLAANRAALDAVSTRPPAMFTCALSNVALPLTVAFWMRPLSTSNLQYALCCAGSNAAWGYQVSVTPSGQAAVDAFVDGVAYSVATASNALAPGAWAHVCATLAPGSNAIYLNGALAGVTPLPAGSSNLPLTTLSLGAQAGSNYAFCGQLDEVRIFGRALAPTEVASVASTTDTFAANQTTAITFEGMTVNDTFGTLTSNANIGSKAFAFAVPGRLGNVCLDLSGNATGLTNTQSVATVFYALPTPLTLPFTVAFWMNPTVTNVVSIPVCFGNATVWGFEFVINAASQLYTDAYIGVTNYSIAPSAATLVQAGLWNHVVATLGVPSTGTGYNTLFLNGAQVAQSTNYTSGALGASSGASAITQLRFGNQIPNTAAYRGQLDEFRMFNRALTPPEVNRLYAKHAFPVALSAPEYGVIVRVSFDGTVDDACGTYANPASAGTLPLAYTYAPAVGTAALDLASNALVLGLSNTPPAAAVSWAATPALPMSVSFLMNVPTSNAPSKQYVLSYGNAGAASPALSLALTPGGQLTSEAYVNSVLYATPTAGTTTVTSNTWVHVVSTLGAPPASSNTLFVNGALIASSTSYAAGALTSSNGAAITTLLAGAQIGSNYAYRGGLDDLRVFNRALLPAEVSCMYSQYSYPVGGTTEYGIAYGLIAHIPFEAGLQDVLGTFTYPTSVGSVANVPYFSPGRVGTRCLDFTTNTFSTNGSLSPTTISYSTTLSPMLPFTCAFWFYMSYQPPGYTIPVCFGTPANWAYEFVIPSNCYLYIDASINGTNYGTPSNGNTYIPPSTWVHIVGTLGVAGSGTGYNMCYVNGNLVGQSGNYTGGMITVVNTTTPTNMLRLGQQIGNNWPHKGYLDDFRMYNRALSAAEVRNLYMSYSPATAPALGLATPSTLNGAVSSSRLGPYFPFSYSPLDVTGTLAPAVTGSVGYMPFRAGMQAAYFPNEANVVAAPTAAANYMAAPFLHTPGLPVSVATWAYFTKAPQAANTYSYLFAISSATADGLVLSATFSTTSVALVSASVNTGTTAASSAFALPVNTWAHLAVVFAPGSALTFYVNGAGVSSNGILPAATALAAHGTMRVGNGVVTGHVRPFAGYLADLRVYTRALAPAEVLTMYQVPLALAPPSASFAPLPSAPLVYLPFNGSLGSAVLTGQLGGYAPGPIQGGQAAWFTSPLTYLTCPLPAGSLQSGGVSVAFWFAAPALPTAAGFAPVLFQLGSLALAVVPQPTLAPSCLFSVAFNGTSYATGGLVAPATWYHVAFTYAFPSSATFASTLSLCVNGSPVPVFTAPVTAVPLAGAALRIANANAPSVAAQFAGFLQEFQAYDRAITAAEVAALYARARIPLPAPALLGWWQFENSLVDATGNGGTASICGPFTDAVTFTNNARVGTAALSIANNPGVAPGLAYVDAPLALLQTGVTPLTLSLWMNVRSPPPLPLVSTPFALVPPSPAGTAVRAVEGWVTAASYGVYCFDRAGNSNAVTLGAVPRGWTHLAVAWGDGNCRVYVNGALSGTVATFAPLAAVHYTSLRLGNSPQSTSPFNGLIDEARLHNKILSAEEVAAVYGAATAATGTAPAMALAVDGHQTTTGNVGIGVTNPSYALDVLGTVRVSTPLVDAVAWFDFEGPNPLSDKSGAANAALSATGAVAYAAGRFGTAAAYLANEASVATAAPAQNTLVLPWTPLASASVACWLKTTAAPVPQSGSIVAGAAPVLTTGASDAAFDSCVDAAGNVYVVGSYTASAPIPVAHLNGVATAPAFYYLPATTASAAYVIKYGQGGALLGFATLDGNGADIARAAACDASGNLYVVGIYQNSTTAALNALGLTVVASGYTMPAVTSTAAFVVKYSGATGAVLGFALVDGTGADGAYGVAYEPKTNAVFVTGNYVSSGVVALNNIATTTTASGLTLPATTGTTNAAFLIKYSAASGGVLGFAVLDGTGSDLGYGVAANGSGVVAVTGTYLSSALLPLNKLATTTVPTFGGYWLPINNAGGGFVATFDAATGSNLGYSTYAGTAFGSIYGVAFDASGNMMVAGSYNSSSTVPLNNMTSNVASGLTLPVTSSDAAFATKYAGASGAVIGAVVANGTGSDVARGVCFDASGTAFVTGYYQSSGVVPLFNSLFAMAPTPRSFVLPIAAVQAGFILRVDGTTGFVEGFVNIAGTGNTVGAAVSADASGNVYASGLYQTSTAIPLVHVDGSPSNFALATTPSYATYLVKLAPAGMATVWELGSLAAYGLSLVSGTGGRLYVIANTVPQAGSGNAVTAGSSDAAVLATNTWYHVAVVFAAGVGVTLFVNGVATASAAVSAAATTLFGNGLFMMGDTPTNGGGRPFAGAYDDLRLFSRALNAVEVAGLYASAGAGTVCTLVVANGGVGIGTTLPQYAAHVVGTITSSAANQMQAMSLSPLGLTATGSNVNQDVALNSKNAGNIVFNASNVSARDAKVACYSHLAVQGANRVHLRLWDKEDTTFGIYASEAGVGLSMARAASTASINPGSIGWNFAGNALRFRAGPTSSTTTGFIWESSGEDPIMSLRTDGYLNVKNGVIANGYYAYGGASAFNGTNVYFYPMNDNGKYGNWRIGGNRCGDKSGLHFEESRLYLIMGNSGNTGQTQHGVISANNGFDWMWRCDPDRQFYVYNNINVLNNGSCLAYGYYANGLQFCDYNRNLMNIGAVTATGNVTTSGAYQVAGTTVIDANKNVVNVTSVTAKNAYFGAAGTVLQAPLTIVASSGGAPGTTAYGAFAFATTNTLDGVFDVAVDNANGFVYAVGRYTTGGTTAIPHLDGTNSIYLLPAASSGGAFVIKYSAIGTVVGFSVLDGTGADVAYAACVDGAGNLYVTGTYLSSGTVALNAIASTTTASGYALPVSNSGAAFLVRWSSAGAVTGFAVLDGTGADVGYDVATDGANNVVVTGSFVGTATVPITTLALVPAASGWSLPISTVGAAYIIKYSSAGAVLGFSVIDGNNGIDAGRGLATDALGNVVAVGYYFATVAVAVGTLAGANASSGFTLPATTAGTRAGYVLKFSAAGALTGLATIDGDGADAAFDVTTDAVGNTYVTGTSLTNVIIPLTNLATSAMIVSAMPSAATGAAFIVKYDASGTLVGFTALDGTGADTGYCVTCDATGNLYATGSYISTIPVTINVFAYGTLASAFALPATLSSTQAGYYVKFDPAGAVLGATTFDGTGADVAYTVATDVVGNVFVGGLYVSSSVTTLKHLDGTASAVSLPVASTAAPFVAQFASRSTPFTISSGGTLGINKTVVGFSPVALDVSGAAAFSTSVAVGKPVATAAALDVSGTAAVSGAVYVGSLGVGIANPGAAALVVNGAVGIGTTAPAAMLHVVGNVYASGDVNAFYTASDARLKTDLVPITADAAARVLDGITPYRFRWNALAPMKREGTADVGLLAQEVAAVLPEATRWTRSHEAREGEHLSMDYTKLIPFLVAAVKENRREIAALHAMM